MQKYPRGSRGSPAKGVVWENRSAGSNPAFCAKKDHRLSVVFFGVRGLVRSRELSRVRARSERYGAFQNNAGCRGTTLCA